MALCLTVAMLATAGLVIDGGRSLAASRAATAVAPPAAREADEQLDVLALNSSSLQLGSQAVVVGDEALSGAGYSGGCSLDGVDGVVCTASTTIHTTMLTLVGIDTLTIHGTGAAVTAVGVP